LIGGIDALLGVSNLQTTTAFTPSQTGAAVTLTGGTGSSATATVDTDGSGDVVGVTITSSGTNYTIGDIITLTEVGGTPGVATFVVAEVA